MALGHDPRTIPDVTICPAEQADLAVAAWQVTFDGRARRTRSVAADAPDAFRAALPRPAVEA